MQDLEVGLRHATDQTPAQQNDLTMRNDLTFNSSKNKGGRPLAIPHPNAVYAATGFSETIEERFWENVFILPYDQGCWLWLAYTIPFGYGQLGMGGRHDRTILAHRLSWILHRGPIPKGMNVLHHCDNPPCVRPDHLFLGTHADNVRDKISKGRASPPPPPRLGMANNKSKLTWEEVQEIRTIYPSQSQRALARAFAVSQHTIMWIVRHKMRRFE